jgi:hypothetical protein
MEGKHPRMSEASTAGDAWSMTERLHSETNRRIADATVDR